MEINLVLADCSLLLATLKCHNDSISIFFIGLLRSLEEVKMAVWIWFYCSWNLKPPTSLFYVLQIEDLHHLLQAIWLMPICFSGLVSEGLLSPFCLCCVMLHLGLTHTYTRNTTAFQSHQRTWLLLSLAGIKQRESSFLQFLNQISGIQMNYW